MVYGSALTGREVVKSPQERSWTTFIECCCADGTAIAPAVIFKGKELQEQWFDRAARQILTEWRFATSPKGWTDDRLAVSWLLDVFIPELEKKRKDDSDAALLIIDGHGSHRTVSMIPVAI